MASYSVDQLLKMGPVQLNALIRPYKEIDAEATQTLHNYCRHHLAAACHSSHLTPGLKWEDIGPKRPKRGHEYLNEALVAKLRQGKVVVTREELACMAKEAGRTMPGNPTPQHCSQHNNISYDTFIKVGASYFAPSYPRLYTHSTGTGHDFAWRGRSGSCLPLEVATPESIGKRFSKVLFVVTLI